MPKLDSLENTSITYEDFKNHFYEYVKKDPIAYENQKLEWKVAFSGFFRYMRDIKAKK